MTACAQAAFSGSEGDVLAIDRLLAAPGTYNGKAVTVAAVANIEFENMTLCEPGQRAFEHCVWLQIDPGPDDSEADHQRYKAARASWSRFNGKKVVVRGVFTSGPAGHRGLWRGEIGRVTSVSEP